MNVCSAPEMRKNLKIVELMVKSGIDFVPIPALNSQHKKNMIELMDRNLDIAINEAEQQEKEINNGS